MQNNEKFICKIFETEMWLYIDRSLPDSKMEFWRSHLRHCNTCRELIGQSGELVSSVSENVLVTMDNVLLEKMISKAIGKGKQNPLSHFFNVKKEKIISVSKIVFASVLVIAAVLISLLSDKNNSVKSVGKELLDWEGSSVLSEIDRITDKINMISQSEWNRQLLIIDQKIESMENNNNKFSFN
jgi:hypothetical protein